MKKFEIEMDIHFTKTIHIDAPSEDAATVLAETMLLCTDALPLTDADMVGLITTATELEKEPARKHSPIDDKDDDEDECFCCGDCTICGFCDEEDDEETSEEDDKEDRIDELLEKLEDALEDVTDSMSALVSVTRALKELTGKDIFSQLVK